MDNETIFEDLCIALYEFGNEYAEVEGQFIATNIDEEELDKELMNIVNEFARDIMAYFEEAYSEN